MSRDELQEFAALHALGLLEGDEAARFERELERNPEAREAYARYLDTSNLLALSAEEVEPPADLEDRILADLPEQSAPALASAPSSAGSGSSDGSSALVAFARWIPWGLAAALAVGCGYLINERTEQAALLAEKEARITYLESEGALANLRIAVLKSRLENAPNAQAVAVWNGELQQGRLSVSNLPAVPAGREYQLWIIDPAYEGPISAGVFNTDNTGALQYAFSGAAAVRSVNAFALSVEKEGGVSSPEGPIVLVSE